MFLSYARHAIPYSETVISPEQKRWFISILCGFNSNERLFCGLLGCWLLHLFPFVSSFVAHKKEGHCFDRASFKAQSLDKCPLHRHNMWFSAEMNEALVPRSRRNGGISKEEHAGHGLKGFCAVSERGNWPWQTGVFFVHWHRWTRHGLL